MACQKLQNLGNTWQIPEKFESCDYQVVPWYHIEDYQTISSQNVTAVMEIVP